MPWPLAAFWRLAVTVSVLAVSLRSAADGLPDRVTSSVATALATAGIPGWAASLAVAAGATAAVVSVWRRAVRPRRRPRDLLAVADPERPYRRDVHAELVVDRRGYLFARRVMFTASGLPWRHLRSLPRDYGERFVRPVAVHTEAGRTWWIVGNEFYWVNSAYSPETVEAVVEALRWRRRPRLAVDMPAGAEDRRETFLATCRPSLGRHNGLVCVRCRGTIDARDAPAARLWSEVGLRAADVQLVCGACGGAALPVAGAS
jgi:hypothetical protein